MLRPGMKKSIYLVFLLCFPACQNQSRSESDTDTGISTSPASLDDEGWILLFDGSSFDHWRGYRAEEMPEGWLIQDGAMLISEPGHGGDLVTRDRFQNFEFELEWKVPDGGNSGIMFHVTEDYGSPWATGPEMQILDNDAFEGGALEKNSAGSNYDLHAPSVDTSKPAGEWNTIRLVVNGPSVEHWMNGTKIVQYELWSYEWRELVDGSKWVNHEDYGMRSEGHIALQGDHSPVAFRNIRLRRLPDTDLSDKNSPWNNSDKSP